MVLSCTYIVIWKGKQSKVIPHGAQIVRMRVPKLPVGWITSWEGTWGRDLLTSTSDALPSKHTHTACLSLPSELRLLNSTRFSWEGRVRFWRDFNVRGPQRGHWA